jgi:ferric-dicitrate binding protein FerR (iron transport regulator)
MTDHIIDWDRLARYVSGESGATERAEIERWAAVNDANRALLDSAKRRWNAATEGTAWNVDAAWSKLAPQLKNVRVEPAVIDIQTRTAKRSPWFSAARLVPLAAAAVLLIAVTVRFSSVNGTPGSATASLTVAEMRTGIGEQRRIDLNDGSEVVLGAASTLRLASGFGDSTREVFLEGQAFLKVKHDASKPFVVNAGGTRAIDLGTAFEVRAYPNEGVRVAVTEGTVEVRRDGSVRDSAVLKPGDVAELPDTGAAVIRRQQDVEQLLGWTRGELVFEDAPLSDVARELERWYDVQVRFEDPALRSLHFSTKLKIGTSLDDVLNLIELSLSSKGVRTQRSGNVVTLRSGPPVRPTANPVVPRGRVEAGA